MSAWETDQQCADQRDNRCPQMGTFHRNSAEPATISAAGSGGRHKKVPRVRPADVLGGSQARRLFHDPLGFVESPDHAANALWVADLVVLKAIWSIGELDRTHFNAPDPPTMC